MEEAKKVGIVIRSNDFETCRAGMLCALYHLFDNNNVKVLIMNDSAVRNDHKDSGFFKLCERIKFLGGLVLFCDTKCQLEAKLQEHFSLYLSHEEVNEIVESRAFDRLTKKEVDIKKFT